MPELSSSLISFSKTADRCHRRNKQTVQHDKTCRHCYTKLVFYFSWGYFSVLKRKTFLSLTVSLVVLFDTRFKNSKIISQICQLDIFQNAIHFFCYAVFSANRNPLGNIASPMDSPDINVAFRVNDAIVSIG